MSITEELKTWVDAYPWRKDHDAAEVRALIDRIDKAHEREMDEARDAAFYLPAHRIALPYDASGKQIDLGDEVVFASGEPEEHFTVESFWLDEDGWHVQGEFDAKPSELRHWEAPTVEALLKQLVFEAANIDVMNVTAMAALAGDYVERIREAVEHEEDK